MALVKSERRAEGIVCVQVEVDQEDVRGLIRRGYLKPERDDGDNMRVTRQEIGRAVSELLTKLAASP